MCVLRGVALLVFINNMYSTAEVASFKGKWCALRLTNTSFVIWKLLSVTGMWSTCRTNSLCVKGHYFAWQIWSVIDICGTVHHHSINKNNQRDAACSIRLYYACGNTLHVSGALSTHHQECIGTVHADSGTIVFWYGVRAGWLGGNPESGTNRTILWPCYDIT